MDQSANVSLAIAPENRIAPTTKDETCVSRCALPQCQPATRHLSKEVESTPFASNSQFRANPFDACDHVFQLLSRRPARRLAQATIRCERQSFRWRVAQTQSYAFGNIV